MQKSSKKLPVSETFHIVKDIIDSKNITFFMQTKEQAEYSPNKIQFSSERYRIPYLLRDMASLCTSPELTVFISDIAHRMTHNYNEENVYSITQEEMEYVIKFIKYSKEEYKKSQYIDLTTIE
jgi:hypothetical protein